MQVKRISCRSRPFNIVWSHGTGTTLKTELLVRRVVVGDILLLVVKMCGGEDIVDAKHVVVGDYVVDG